MMMGNVSIASESAMLLQILSDPKKYKAQIEALVAHKDAADSAAKASEAVINKASTAAEDLLKRTADLSDREAKLEREHAVRLAELEVKKVEFSKQVERHNAKVAADLNAADIMHVKRLREVDEAAREYAARNDKRDGELNKLKSELDESLAAVERRNAELNHRDVATGHALRAAQKAQADGEALRDKYLAKYNQLQASLQSLPAVD